MDPRDVVEANREEILAICRRHGARKVRLFGSAAREDAGTASDVDLLVELEPGRSLLDHVALKQDLEDLLGVGVDVVNEAALHWSLKDKVQDEAVPI